jgi:shikimate dehydrogenase
MSPKIDAKPNLDYRQMNERFYLYDLIYNPAETKFMSEGKKYGANVKNGLEMLELQAEKSWEIWNS